MYVQDTVSSGNYYLEAFTSSSIYKNDTEREALRKLRIVQKISANKNQAKRRQKKNTKNKSIQTSIKKEKISFHLFPEGGDLVANLESKVAFKTVDSKGFPLAITGTLYENNKPLKSIQTAHAGMGLFSLQPKKDSLYYVVLDSFSTQKYYLPKIKEQGKVIRVLSSNKKELVLHVSQTKSESKETIYIRLQQKGKVHTIVQGNIKESLTIKIPTATLPQGIAEITLFNKSLKPLAERLVYVNPEKKLKITARLNKERFATKEKVTVNITVTDDNNIPQVAHLGMSVNDKLYTNTTDAKNIITHYQLSTQLKGSIYNPAYYFNKKNKNRKQTLDLLLLTQGWRRYVWNERVLKDYNQNNAPIISDTIFGSISKKGKPFTTKKQDQEKLRSKSIHYTTGDLENQGFLLLGSLGRFQILPQHLSTHKYSYVYFKLLPEKNKKLYPIVLQSKQFSVLENHENHENYQDYYEFDYPLKNIIPKPFVKPYTALVDYKLDEIVVKSKKSKVFRDKYLGSLDSLLRAKYKSTDYICVNNILNCSNHNDGRKPIVGIKYLTERGKGNIVEVIYKSPNNNSNYSPEELLKLNQVVAIKSYYPNKEFYSPVYDKKEEGLDIPDFRNTLFWKPDIITNKKGEATISFFTSDLDTPFTGVIEGLGLNSLLGTSNFEFYVRKKK
ncbi:hypothetical protein N9V96_02000 [Polaribacter sp.]|nr:hypothetical protein [Polaribacter sp.]